ncbi:hypothetical protein C4375_13400 [Devosia sp. I507]|nr:hypothetical protein C4375_13400 [Devosia sp. I507]
MQAQQGGAEKHQVRRAFEFICIAQDRGKQCAAVLPDAYQHSLGWQVCRVHQTIISVAHGTLQLPCESDPVRLRTAYSGHTGKSAGG